ncbi:hypothetical protein FEE96_02600 [Parasedimentitalea maritima]|uniref:Uncharacterized protein n=1 Tax=Parasedimentitalea maritima TaxID=2578117 RepID=A0A5R8ZS78_9RHOB|nr:hypothetical protein [Zongyanglinia marina]KAE9632686.1 hypothetical protein GP644_02630 [Zongyanglinia marina]TLP69193.1 hypothetical protein FEE96_02600 [Zongyanglinia marina]
MAGFIGTFASQTFADRGCVPNEDHACDNVGGSAVRMAETAMTTTVLDTPTASMVTGPEMVKVAVTASCAVTFPHRFD